MRYATMRIKMKDDGADEFFARLRVRLDDCALPPQEVIASAIDTDQPFISRAKRGALKRVTARVQRLDDYLSRRATLSAKLDEQGDTFRGAVQHRSVTRLHPKRTRDDREVKLARKSCETYLSEGYNPRVLIDQIDLLRKAQSKSL